MNHIVIDTNIFLHFRMFDQIDWEELGAEVPAELVVCMPVLHELDAKKADPLFSSRARQVLRRIEELDDGSKQISPKLGFAVWVDEVDPSTMTAPLMSSSVDDQIIQSMKQRQDEDASFIIASDDTAMRLKAKKFGFRTIRPSDDDRLKGPKDPIQRKLHAVQSELTRLKSRAPDCKLVLSDGIEENEADRIVEFSRRVDAPLDVEEQIEHMRTSLRLRAPSPTHSFDILSGYTPSQISRYLLEVDEYLERYRAYCEAVNEYRALQGNVLRFSLWLRNDGTAPARDVQVRLFVPTKRVADLEEQIGADDEDDPVEQWFRPPTAPEPPTAPSPGLLGYDSGHLIRSLQDYAPSFDPIGKQLADALSRQVSEPAISIDRDQAIVFVRVSQLPHLDSVHLGRFVGRFLGQSAGQSVELPFQIVDSNSIEPTNGTLVVRCASGDLVVDDENKN